VKLLKVELLGNKGFNSLPQKFKMEFSSTVDSTSIHPKCIIGLNGSGKSNLLELLSEIFFSLEMYLAQRETNALKLEEDFGYEIEYLLPLSIVSYLLQLNFEDNDKYAHIKITKKHDGYPVFYIKKVKESKKKFVPQDERLYSLLPKKIIGYSSGLNELISNSYLKMQFQAFKDFEDRNTSEISYHFDTSRLFFMSYESNSLIVIANYLLSDPNKIKIFKEELKISSLNSFRIKIRFQNYDNNDIFLPKEIEDDIKKLKLCSTIFTDRGKGKKRELVMDFYVNEALHEGFKNHFNHSFELFKSFYRLDLLNINLVPKSIRNQILKAPRSLNISNIIPCTPSKKLFDFEYIKFDKVGIKNSIDYKNLSDGEHQFLQVFGSLSMLNDEGNLFLLDEAETHFNPKWRSKMITIIDSLLNTTTKMPNQEIILTTHSPFILSDTKKEDIYRFKKINGKVTYENYAKKDVTTYGASISYLLEEFFEKIESMGDMSYKELKNIIKNIETLDDYREAKIKLNKFGDSNEKFDAYNFLNRKRKEL
jgi:restriction system-associated AAA family ATPase